MNLSHHKTPKQEKTGTVIYRHQKPQAKKERERERTDIIIYNHNRPEKEEIALFATLWSQNGT